MAQLLGLAAGSAPVAAAMPPDLFHVVINQMIDPFPVPLTSAHFTFDAVSASKWRFELTQDVIRHVTSDKTIPLRLCIYLTPSGCQALGVTHRMDVRACLIPAPGSMDGAAPYGWKTVCHLQPGHSLAAIVSMEWRPPDIPVVVLMIEAVRVESFPSYPALHADGWLEDEPTPDAPAQQYTLGAQSAAAHAGGEGTHIATLPMNLVSSFIGKAGMNVNALRTKYGGCKINVDKATGSVMVTGCTNLNGLYAEVQAFIDSGGVAGGGGGGGGGKGPSRHRGKGGRGKGGGGGMPGGAAGPFSSPCSPFPPGAFGPPSFSFGSGMAP